MGRKRLKNPQPKSSALQRVEKPKQLDKVRLREEKKKNNMENLKDPILKEIPSNEVVNLAQKMLKDFLSSKNLDLPKLQSTETMQELAAQTGQSDEVSLQRLENTLVNASAEAVQGALSMLGVEIESEPVAEILDFTMDVIKSWF
jgi:ERCC4-type nuclease